jgi:hypothetical protein
MAAKGFEVILFCTMQMRHMANGFHVPPLNFVKLSSRAFFLCLFFTEILYQVHSAKSSMFLSALCHPQA